MRISVITNGPKEHQLRKIKSLGLKRWVDEKDIIISSAVGCSKPDKRIFHMVSDHGLYVGDSYENDVIGAGNAGWDVIWLNKYGARDQQHIANYIVKNENELLDRIQCLY